MTTTNAIPTLNDPDATVVLAPNFAAFRIEERFSFVRAYDPKVQVIEGYRHAVIRYRNTDGKSTKAAQMVTVPAIVLPDDYKLVLSDKEQAVFIGLIEDAEDMIIRGLIDEPTKASKVSWDVLGKEKAIEYLTAARVSQRLTKEQIEAWFLVAGKDWCDTRAAQICEAKNISDADTVSKQKAGTLNAYKDRMMKLAAPVPNLGQEEATALKNMLVSAKLDDDMAKVLKNKLEQMLNPKVVECSDL